MNGILSVPLPRWEGLGEGENGKGFSPPPLSSPIKGEEIVFKEIGKPRPVGGVIHFRNKFAHDLLSQNFLIPIKCSIYKVDL